MKVLFGLPVLCLSLSLVAKADEPAARCPKLDPLCKEIPLEAPKDARVVVAKRGSVELIFGFDAFAEAAKGKRWKALSAWLATQTGRQIKLDRATPNLQKGIDFVVAALLEAGRAKVISGAGRPVDRIVIQRWDWVGCGGGCRQAGREFRLAIPGKPFLRTTDLFEDGEPGTFYPPPAPKPPSE